MKKSHLFLGSSLIALIGFSVIQNKNINANALQNNVSFSFSRLALDEATYNSLAGGNIRFYQYVYDLNAATFSMAEALDLSLSQPAFLQLPLTYLNYEHNVSAPLQLSISYQGSTQYTLTPKTYEPLIMDLATINFPLLQAYSTYQLTINIPTTDTAGISLYQDALDQAGVLHSDRSGYDYLNTIYDNNYSVGFEDGESIGYEDGHSEGYIEGYTLGLEEGGEESPVNNVFVLLEKGWNGMANMLEIEVFPDFTIGGLLIIPFLFTIGLFIFKVLT